MKTLKIISFVSVLLICGLQEVGLPIFFSIFYIIVNFFVNINYIDIDFWIGGILGFSLLGTLIIYLLCRNGKDRFLLLFCVIALLPAILYLTGSVEPANYKRISFWFIVPFTIFIISSIWLIILNFMKPVNKNKKEN